MSKDNSFHNYVVYDLLGDTSGISSKAMFGGHSVYKDNKIFAIIAGSNLYLKERKETFGFFTSHKSHQFTYSKKDGKRYAMNYWFVPEEVYENREIFAEWVDMALAGE